MGRQRGQILLYLLAGIAALAMLSGIAYKIRESGKDAVRLEWAEANRKAREAEAAKGDAAAKGLEVDRGKTRTIFKTITQTVDKIVEKPVYRNVCLEPDGLCIANAALLEKSADSCKPDKPVPASKSAGGRDRGERVAQDR